MATLQKVFLAVFSGNKKWGGTKSRMYVVGNRQDRDELYLTFFTDRDRLEVNGRSHLFVCLHVLTDLVPRQGKTYAWDTDGTTIDGADLSDVYFRLGIAGSDAWVARHAFMWAETDDGVVPLALATDLDDDNIVLSSDGREGLGSIPLPKVGRARGDTQLDQLLLVAGTGGASGAESDSPFEVVIVENGQEIESFRIDPERKRFNGRTLVQVLDLSQSRRQNDLLRTGAQVIVRSLGNDWWHPSRVHVFGMTRGAPRAMVPLVYQPGWDLGGISAEASDSGAPEVTLDLVQ